MRPERIKRIIAILNEEGLDEIEVGNLFSRVRIVKRRGVEREVGLPADSSLASGSEEQAEKKVEQEENVVPAMDAEVEDESGLHKILSPMVGTFYASPSPDKGPFVSVGERIKKGEIICIIEAMKLMNEVEAEVEGVVREILVEDSHPVEYGQPLFIIEPS